MEKKFTKPENESGKLNTTVKQSQTNPHNKGKSHHRRKRKTVSEPEWDISQFEVEAVPDKTRFHDLGLADVIMHAIQDLGFEYCSPIQAQILPQTLKGNDAIGKAQTGTGKTAAFLITLIQDLLDHTPEERFLFEPRALIIAPTRELVMQIANDARDLCRYAGLHTVTMVGGLEYGKQKQQMEHQLVDIVVATPGRLIDFMTRKDLSLEVIETLVLDEADRMLDMGFIPQVKRIVRATPRVEHRQTQLFSATFNQDVLNLASQWTYEPVNVEVEPEQVATDTVEQKVYMVSNDDKFKLLVNILHTPEVERVIIFANRRDQTQRLFDRIRKTDIKVGILSGEITQNKRSRTLEDFKTGKIKALVATDVVGRGIHIDGITHVVNYNLPDNPDDYVHRIGRTGRAGSCGIAITLACEYESFELPAIEDLLGTKLKCELPPEALLK